MKFPRATCVTAITLFTLLAVPARIAAQQTKRMHPKYRVVDVGTLGGPTSGFNFNSRILNDRDAAVGFSDTSVFDPNCNCYVSNGFLWNHGVLTDLGPLPGGANTFADAINSIGTAAGVSENGLIDPVLGIPESVATTWKDGQIADLGTLGGSFSLPNDINRRGQLAGGATNTVPDPDGLGTLLTGLPSSTQWRAALWQNGTAQDLGTLGTGPDAFALFVNERGQVAGFSYTNSITNPETGIPTVDPFFWEKGRMIDVGTLGGVFGTGMGLNNKGQVVGSSDLAGDLTHHPYSWLGGVLTDIGTFGGDNGSAAWVNDSGHVVGEADFIGDAVHHAFLWEKNRKLKDLKPAGSGACSNAFSINSSDQVVGNSTDCHGTGLGATLWDNGSVIDLNSFVSPGSGIFLRESVFINNRGEIAVIGSAANGDDHGFILAPCKHGHDRDCRESANTSPHVSQRTRGVTRDGSASFGKFHIRSVGRN
jgi:probable HAF family extracellular repeat protein